MVTATAPEPLLVASSVNGPKTKTQTPRASFKARTTQLLSQPIPIIDFGALPAPTVPLPMPSSTPPSPSPMSTPSPSKTPSRKSSHDKIEKALGSVSLVTTSLRPPPRPSSRPRSIVSHLALSSPPSERLPPLPPILHSNDTAPGSPTTPTSPTFLSARSLHQTLALSTSLPLSPSRSPMAIHHRMPSSSRHAIGEKTKRPSLSSASSAENINHLCNSDAPLTFATKTENARKSVAYEEEIPPRPLGLVATRYYGIESSMRWREGVDPVEKRFASSNRSWRCQDRFAVFFRPGDQIGPDQVVTKTFWSEAWPYPIETILYGTTGPWAGEADEKTSGHRSDHESDRQPVRARGGPRNAASESSLKTAASFPPLTKNQDPRYITTRGVQRIARVSIAMPDVAIHQMDATKAPIKVELRIFIIESPLRIHATAQLLGCTVVGTVDLYL